MEKTRANADIDIILMDIMMPRMDGFAVLEIIRAGFETARLPVILLTAKGSDNDVLHGYSIGASLYLTKPFDNVNLVKAVNAMLEKRAPEFSGE